MRRLGITSPHLVSTFVAATPSAVIAVGLLTGVAAIFRNQGTPSEHSLAAERACAAHTYVSERENCIREWLAASTPQTLAKK